MRKVTTLLLRMSEWPIPNASRQRIKAANPWAPLYAASASEAQALAVLWAMLFVFGGLLSIAVVAGGQRLPSPWSQITFQARFAGLFFGFGAGIEAWLYGLLYTLVRARKRSFHRGHSKPEATHWPFTASDASLLLQIALTVVVGLLIAHGSYH
jgi:hypothetical protein